MTLHILTLPFKTVFYALMPEGVATLDSIAASKGSWAVTVAVFTVPGQIIMDVPAKLGRQKVDLLNIGAIRSILIKSFPFLAVSQ